MTILKATTKDELAHLIHEATREHNTDTHQLVVVRILCKKNDYQAQMEMLPYDD